MNNNPNITLMFERIGDKIREVDWLMSPNRCIDKYRRTFQEQLQDLHHDFTRSRFLPYGERRLAEKTVQGLNALEQDVDSQLEMVRGSRNTRERLESLPQYHER